MDEEDGSAATGVDVAEPGAVGNDVVWLEGCSGWIADGVGNRGRPAAGEDSGREESPTTQMRVPKAARASAAMAGCELHTAANWAPEGAATV